jgi:hypothetical protein
MRITLQLEAELVAKVLLLFLVVGRGETATAASGPPPPATRTYYQFTTIDIPGSPWVDAYGINDQGLVSGAFADAAWHYHGFLWQTGKVTTIDAPGWVNTVLCVNNNQGVVAGSYDNSMVSHACLYNVPARTWAALPDIPGKPVNWANGINNRGVAVGAALEGTASGSVSNGVAWIWDGSAYSLFTVPGASGAWGTLAFGINDQGQISGYYQDSQGVYHGFLKQGAEITNFDVPGADGGTGPGTINNVGDVAGPYMTSGNFHGFILRGGEFATLDVPGAQNTYLHANNNRGDLAGRFWNSSGGVHGFLAMPERLSIANSGTNLLLSWPVASERFQLQITPSLSGETIWSPVAEGAVTNGSIVSVLVPASPGAACFRLMRVP